MKNYYITFIDSTYIKICVAKDRDFIDEIKDSAMTNHGFIEVFDDERCELITINTRTIKWITREDN